MLYGEFTPEKREELCEEISITGRIVKSSRKIGVDPSYVAVLRRQDKAFDQAVNEALAIYSEGLEEEAHRRGVEGVDEPVFGNTGPFERGVIGHVRRYSDRLLELLLKKNNPAFRDHVKVDANLTGGVLLVSDGPADPNRWKEENDA